MATFHIQENGSAGGLALQFTEVEHKGGLADPAGSDQQHIGAVAQFAP